MGVTKVTPTCQSPGIRALLQVPPILGYLKLFQGSRWSNRSKIIVNVLLVKKKNETIAAYFEIPPDISLN
jgi:hypothetical protein